MSNLFCKYSKQWFLHNKRDFPWRDFPSPYAVWVSEVMLQQTVAKTVIPYFTKWMDKFPNIASLAQAPLDEILKLWEGLGYYSRAKNLHNGAKEVMTLYDGSLPKKLDSLLKIKGIGPYTANAIRAFAFHEKALPVDVNAKRVLSRVFLSTNFKNQAEEMLAKEPNPWVLAEALIELGALVCRPKPLCSICPLKHECLAYKNNKALDFPPKAKRKVIIKLERPVYILVCNKKIFIRKIPDNLVLGGLHEFPHKNNGFNEEPKGVLVKALKPVFHSYTKYRVTLFPKILETSQISSEGFFWVNINNAQKLPFCGGHKKLFEGLKQHLETVWLESI